MSDKKQFDCAVLKCLTNCWIKGRNPEGGEPVSAEKLKALYAEGDTALDIVYEYEGAKFMCRNFAEYWERYKDAVETYGTCQMTLVGDPTVEAAGDLAVTSFTYHKAFKDSPEKTTDAHATVVWKRIDGEWRIVREHVTAQ